MRCSRRLAKRSSSSAGSVSAEVAEQLVGELAVRLREVAVGGGRRGVREGAAAATGRGRRELRGVDETGVDERGEVLPGAARRHPELVGDLLGGRLAAPAHGVEHLAPARGQRGERRGPVGRSSHRTLAQDQVAVAELVPPVPEVERGGVGVGEHVVVGERLAASRGGTTRARASR